MNYITHIQIWWKAIYTTVTLIDDSIELHDISRVYVIACNNEWEIWLIYNSKRQIRWFPWWRKEIKETVLETAHREFIEEMWYNLESCIMKYLIENNIDSDQTERQIICFGRIGVPDISQIEINESVTEMWFFSLDDVRQKMGNDWLREPIIADFWKKFRKNFFSSFFSSSFC